jgi:hypothetical protein
MVNIVSDNVELAMPGISTTALAEAIDVPAPKINEWVSRGFITSESPRNRPGGVREWTLAEALVVAVYAKTIQGGITRQEASAQTSAILQVIGELLNATFAEDKDTPPDWENCDRIVFFTLMYPDRERRYFYARNQGEVVSIVAHVIVQQPERVEMIDLTRVYRNLWAAWSAAQAEAKAKARVAKAAKVPA